jgi:hypothetical protein
MVDVEHSMEIKHVLVPVVVQHLAGVVVQGVRKMIGVGHIEIIMEHMMDKSPKAKALNKNII